MDLVIVGELLEPVEERQVANPLVCSEAFSDDGGKFRVALGHPAARSHSVGDANKLVRDAAFFVVRHKGREHIRFHNLGMDGSNTVDLFKNVRVRFLSG